MTRLVAALNAALFLGEFRAFISGYLQAASQVSYQLTEKGVPYRIVADPVNMQDPLNAMSLAFLQTRRHIENPLVKQEILAMIERVFGYPAADFTTELSLDFMPHPKDDDKALKFVSGSLNICFSAPSEDNRNTDVKIPLFNFFFESGA